MDGESSVQSARILSYEQVQKRLEKYWKTLEQLPRRALAKYKKHVAAKLAQPSGRLRATAMHDFMIDELRVLFGADLIYSNGRWLLQPSQDLVVQFKKVNSKGRTSNYPTQTALNFETQLLLPGFPTCMRITCGYRLDKTNTEVADVSLIARDGDRVVWHESLEPQLPLLAPMRANAKQPAKKLSAKKEVADARGVAKKVKKGTTSGD
jgi:hypothetical protein